MPRYSTRSASPSLCPTLWTSCSPWRKPKVANSPPSSSRTQSANSQNRAPKTSCGKTTWRGDPWKSRLILALRQGYHKKPGLASRGLKHCTPSSITLTWSIGHDRRSTPRWEHQFNQARPLLRHPRFPACLPKALLGRDLTGCPTGTACGHDHGAHPGWGRQDPGCVAGRRP